MPPPPAEPGPAGAEDRLRKWYFCANEAAMSGETVRLLVAAVRSCLETTDLQPNLVYDGPRSPSLRVLRDMGVTIHRHAPSLAPALRPAYGDAYDRFRGHWLRIDIPLIETGDATVLYTDIDVLFLSMPPMLRRPETIAVAPERWRFRWAPFNSGVMLMNLPGLRAVDDAFRDSILRRLQGGFRYPPHDQASYRAFFADRADRLPLSMNWKPYWGPNDRAHVLHFHGPKPALVRRIEAGGPGRAPREMAYYWRLSPEGYRQALDAVARAHPPGAPLRPFAGRGTRIVDAPPPSAARRLAQDAGGWTRDALQTLRRRDWAGARHLLIRRRRSPTS